MFQLAMVQMKVDGGKKSENLARAVERIGEAAAGGAEVVLLPEVMDLGWTHGSARDQASEVPGGDVCTALADAARRHGVYVCGGLVERDGDRIFNSAVLLGPDGELLLRQRKLNELDIAHDCYDQGDRLGVCHTPLGSFGLLICADAVADGFCLSRSLGYMGADIILSPCAWAVPPDHDNAAEPYGNMWRDAYGAVARDFSLWFAGVSNIGPVSDGPWRGWNCIGCSLLVDPEGEIARQGAYGAEAELILRADIALTPRPTRGTGWPQYYQKAKAYTVV